MSPAGMAAQVYDREPCARSFAEDVEAHMLNGYVFSSPKLFMLARAVPRHADPALIIDPWHKFPEKDCNGWLIYLAAGDMREFFRCEPFPDAVKDWIAWERKNVLRWHRYQRTKRLCKNLPPSFWKPLLGFSFPS